MSKEPHYMPVEERLNVLSHGIGIVLSILAMVWMLAKAENSTARVAVTIFGMSLITLYTASTLYHASKEKVARARLRIFDHAAIYLLIAGTYTPVCLITLYDSIGISLLIIIWCVGIVGVILKLFFTGRYDKLSTFMYVAMGWIAILAIKPLLMTMHADGLLWLAVGGACYMIGAVFYSIRSLSFNHAIFHFFVLGGSLSHFVMIYFYIL